MQVMIKRCAGLDVHQATVVACVLICEGRKRPRTEVRSFSTMTGALEELREWLAAERVTHVGMESTGVYWLPVYAVLEGHFELIVGSARHIKNVPGRKTDVKDAEWIAELVCCGLIRPSFVPAKPLRDLRELLRYRRKLVESQTAERNRLQRLLETANIKLASVVSDVLGVSGRDMLRALIEGTASTEEMADLARRRLRRKRPELTRALNGRMGEEQRFLLALQLRRLEAIEQDIELLEQRIAEKLAPYDAEIGLLMTIPGVDWVVAATLVAEIGTDMNVFVSAHHLAAWAGVCPGNHETGGKRKSVKARRGNRHLRATLVEAAIGASRAKGSYLKDKFYRLRARRGAMRAALAIATRSWSPPITCSPAASATASWVRHISTKSIRFVPLQTSSVGLRGSVMSSPSNRRRLPPLPDTPPTRDLIFVAETLRQREGFLRGRELNSSSPWLWVSVVTLFDPIAGATAEGCIAFSQCAVLRGRLHARGIASPSARDDNLGSIAPRPPQPGSARGDSVQR